MLENYFIQQVEKAGGICLRLGAFSRGFAIFVPAKILAGSNPKRVCEKARTVIVEVRLHDIWDMDHDVGRFAKTGIELWVVSSEESIDRRIQMWFGGTENAVC